MDSTSFPDFLMAAGKDMLQIQHNGMSRSLVGLKRQTEHMVSPVFPQTHELPSQRLRLGMLSAQEGSAARATLLMKKVVF
jgi:hypothetical protein